MSKPWLEWPRKLLDSDKNDFFSILSTNHVLGGVLDSVRSKFFSRCQPLLTSDKAGVFMKGGLETPVYNGDCDYEFMQDGYFRYLFGVDEPDLVGVVDLAKREFLLFVPKFPEEYQRVMGPARPFTWYKDRFHFHEVFHRDQLKEQLLLRGIEELHVMNCSLDSDSKLPYCLSPKNDEELKGFRIHDEHLYNLLTECRVQKTQEELDLLRVANRANARAHGFLMQICRPGLMERQLEAAFKGLLGFSAGNRGMLHYGAIVASGVRSAVLHYGHAAAANDEILQSGELVLVDMGGIFQGYGADITATYPVNGRFTSQQVGIYEAVLDAHDQVIKNMKPGVNWLSMHILAEKVILRHLARIGLVVTANFDTEVDEMVNTGLGAVFMPHGLGHFLGLRTHDVGGFTQNFTRASRVGLNYCRTSRDLLEGMFITVEPGCYFVDFLIKKALNTPNLARWLNKDLLRHYQNFGGIRIESNVAVTKDGSENFTVLPRTIQDIEEFMNLPKQ